ncbi:MAG: type II toxin-antitoxin system VapC family toxin [Planctomycetia bacterium]|nr:type II toxin-antitoxin system VapC family toxin [Planctomycetia bacterium]
MFADTSFYVAIANRHDLHHVAAARFAQGFRGMMVTTDFVLVEFGNWMSRTGDRPVFVRLVEQLLADPQCNIVPATRTLFDAGRNLYVQRPDKNWSLTDCTSFVVMRDQNIAEALTADHHFEQAGFAVLLK